MADTFTAAFAEIEGPEFDLAVGYDIEAPAHPAPDDEIAATLVAFDYPRHIARIRYMLGVRYMGRGMHDDIEEAVQEALLEVYEGRRYLFTMPPESWMGLLYKASCHWIIKLGRRERVDSIDGLAEMAGDAALTGAKPVLPAALPNVDEDAKYTPPPKGGYRVKWERLQMLGAAQRFRDQHGRPPRVEECGKGKGHGLPPSSQIYREFGDFNAFLLEAGMVPYYTARKKKWGPVDSAESVLSFRRREGYWPGRADIDRTANDLPPKGACNRYFGGIRADEVQAGVEAILGPVDAPGDVTVTFTQEAS
jgi:DNA-directed RNA polymerase specialized sigma24 family protein